MGTSKSSQSAHNGSYSERMEGRKSATRGAESKQNAAEQPYLLDPTDLIEGPLDVVYPDLSDSGSPTRQLGAEVR